MTARSCKAVAFAGGVLLAGSGAAFAAGNAAQPTICDRACWGARVPQGSISTISALTRAVVHHTAGASDYNTTSQATSIINVRAVQNYHMDANGWSDIGYHFLVDKLGNRFEGREGSMASLPRGAHDGVNTNSFGYNIMGYYHTPYNQVPTPESRGALYDIIAWRQPNGWSPYGGSAYGIGSDVGFVCGHRDAKATACPGDLLYAYIGTDNNGGEARDEINARIDGGTPPPSGVVDNDDGAGAYGETGSWSTSGSAGYNGGTYRFATVGAAATATWSADLSAAGTYEVSVIYVAGTNRATSASYSIGTASGAAAASVDQTLGSLSWQSLGVYSFNAGVATVTLDAGASTGGSVVIADAVKFTAAAPPPTMSVSSIVPSTVKSGKKYKGRVVVTILDGDGAPVSGADVTGTFTGSYSQTLSGTTGSNGQVTLTTTSSVNAPVSFQFCVDDVTGAMAYDDAANVETCDGL